jgi:hypothetical protein
MECWQMLVAINYSIPLRRMHCWKQCLVSRFQHGLGQQNRQRHRVVYRAWVLSASIAEQPVEIRDRGSTSKCWRGVGEFVGVERARLLFEMLASILQDQDIRYSIWPLCSSFSAVECRYSIRRLVEDEESTFLAVLISKPPLPRLVTAASFMLLDQWRITT